MLTGPKKGSKDQSKESPPSGPGGQQEGAGVTQNYNRGGITGLVQAVWVGMTGWFCQCLKASKMQSTIATRMNLLPESGTQLGRWYWTRKTIGGKQEGTSPSSFLRLVASSTAPVGTNTKQLAGSCSLLSPSVQHMRAGSAVWRQ